MLAHPEAQATHEAMIGRLQGVDSGEITVAHCARLLRAQAVLVCTGQNTLRQGGTEQRELSAGRWYHCFSQAHIIS